MKLRKYIVTITETLKKEVQVFEKSEEDARKAVVDEYMNGNIVLTADDYMGTAEFTVREEKLR